MFVKYDQRHLSCKSNMRKHLRGRAATCENIDQLLNIRATYVLFSFLSTPLSIFLKIRSSTRPNLFRQNRWTWWCSSGLYISLDVLPSWADLLYVLPSRMSGWFFRALLLLRQKTRGVLSKTPLGQKCQPGVFKKVVEVGRSTLQGLTIMMIHILMEVHSIIVKVLTCSVK